MIIINNLFKQFSATSVTKVLESGVIKNAYIIKYQKYLASNDYLIFLNLWYAKTIDIKFSNSLALDQEQVEQLDRKARLKYIQILTSNNQRGKQMFGVGVFVYGYMIGKRLFEQFPQLRDEIDYWSCMQIYLLLYREVNGQFCSMSYLKLTVKAIFTQKSLNYLLENKSKRNIQKQAPESFFGQKIQTPNYTFKDSDIALLVQSINFGRKKNSLKHRDDKDFLSRKIHPNASVTISNQFYSRQMNSPMINIKLRKKSLALKSGLQIRLLKQRKDRQQKEQQEMQAYKVNQSPNKMDRFKNAIKQLRYQNQNLQNIRHFYSKNSTPKTYNQFLSKAFHKQDQFMAGLRSSKSLTINNLQVDQVPIEFEMHFPEQKEVLLKSQEEEIRRELSKPSELKLKKQHSSIQFKKQLENINKRSDLNKEIMKSFYFRSRA